MRQNTLGLFALLSLQAMAQPPIDLQWSVFLPYGSEQAVDVKLSVDQDIVSWMLFDSSLAWSTSDGVIRRYLDDGAAITGYWPEHTVGCGSLDIARDFLMRNDSLWGIATWQYIGGSEYQDILYCAVAPGDGYAPDPSLNVELYDGVHDLHVSNDRWFICAWQQIALSEWDGRIVSLDLGSNVLWETVLPGAAFGRPHAVVRKGDSLAVAAFPDLHWLDVNTGAPLGSTTLYAGPEGTGRLLWENGHLYWAAEADGVVYCGKLDTDTSPLWSNTTVATTVKEIAVDDLGRMWIGGNGNAGGVLTRIGATGSVDGSWPYGATVSDLAFANGKLTWTGKLQANTPDSYLISGTPNP